jgi:hypothetical protein
MPKLITAYPRIKIDEIRKALPFIEEKSCTFKFNPDTQKKFSVLMHYAKKELLITYQLQKEWTYHIKLKKQECNFGNIRYWLECPIKRCKKSVSTLYLKNEIFACRTCHKLFYRSQTIKTDFPFYRLERIEKKLQSKWGKNGAPPKRPKGMCLKFRICNK